MARPAEPKPGTGEAAFTLVEVLVAFAILGLGLAVLMQVFSGGMKNTRAGERYLRAAVIADSTLAQVGRTLPLAEGEYTGAAGGGYRWAVRIGPQALGLASATAAAAPKTRIYAVSVTVGWRDGAAERNITLDTLRLSGAPR